MVLIPVAKSKTTHLRTDISGRAGLRSKATGTRRTFWTHARKRLTVCRNAGPDDGANRSRDASRDGIRRSSPLVRQSEVGSSQHCGEESEPDQGAKHRNSPYRIPRT